MPLSGLTIAIAVAVAYLFGSVPFGLLAGRLKGVDVRRAGSGNIGATNVARTVGRPWGVLVFFLDTLKGFGPTAAALIMTRPPASVGEAVPSSVARELFIIGVGAAALLGHIFPVFLGFRGGKGVATGLGVLLAVNPPAGISAFGVWLIVLGVGRYVSVASVVAAACYPPLGLLTGGLSGQGIQPGWLSWGLTCGFCALVLVRHRGNLSRLLAGTEPKIGQSRWVRTKAVAPDRACDGPP